MRKFCTPVAFILALVLALGLVQTGAFAEGEKVKITFAAQAGVTEIACMEELKEMVNAKLADEGIEMEILSIPMNDWPDYYKKIVSMFAAGNAPDMGRCAERLMANFIDDDQVLDITDHVNALIESGEYYDGAFYGTAHKDGKFYGIPSGQYQLVTLYNKDIFDAANVPYPSSDWDNPTTLEFVTENAPKLTSGEGANKIYGFNYFSYNPYTWMMVTKTLNNELYAYDAEGNIKINTEEHIKALSWYKDLIDNGSVPSPTETAILSTADMFFTGKLAMTVEGTWNLNRSPDAKFRIGYATLPSASTGMTTQFLDCFVIYNQTKHPEEAWRVLETIYSKEGWDIMVKHNLGGSPVLKSTYADFINSYVTNVVGEGAPDIECMEKLMNYGISAPYSVYWEEAVAQMKAAMEEWMLGQLSSEDLANKNQKIMETLKAKSEQ